MKRALAAVATAAALTGTTLGLAMGSTSSRMRLCGPKSAKTLARSSSARLFLRQAKIYGCANGKRHQFLIGNQSSCLVAPGLASPVAAAGQLAGYGLVRCLVDTRSASVVIRRLSDGKQLNRLAASTGKQRPESFDSVASLVLRSDGSVAWITTVASPLARVSTAEVHRADRHGAALLDSGPAINPRSLSLHGSTVSWTDGGSRRSASLS